LVKNSYVVGTP